MLLNITESSNADMSMNKIKKYLKLFLLIFSIGFLGCSVQIKDVDQKIIGEWFFKKTLENQKKIHRYFILKENGEWKGIDAVKLNPGDDGVIVMESGLWTWEEDHLTLKTLKSTLDFDPEEATKIKVLFLSKSKLKVKYNNSVETYFRITEE